MKALMLGTIILAAAQFAFSPLLPGQVAVHFGPGGSPDNWMTRQAYLLLSSGTILFIGFLMTGLARWMHAIPKSFVNMPYKDRWFDGGALELEARRLLHRMCLVFGWETILFMALLFWIVVVANQAVPVALPMGLFLSVLGGFVVTILVTVGVLVMKLRRSPEDANRPRTI